MAKGRRPTRRVAVATAITLLTVLALAPSSVQASHGGLVVIADTTYQVLPAEGRVHVTIDAVATSHEPDTPEGRTFFTGVSFAVPPDVQNVIATSGGNVLQVTVEPEGEAYAVAAVEFSRGVFFGQSYPYRVQFDLVDPGGAPGRDLRIGRSLVAFPVWAFGTGDEPGSTVQVVLPPGFGPSIQGGEMEATPRHDGVVLSASPADPLAFFAYVTADRPGAFVDSTVEVELDGEVARFLVRAWDDDPGWAARTTELLTGGLPVLRDLIGLPYPVSGQLRLEEAAVSRLGSYAGSYDTVTGVIRVRYDADPYVTLHEAAHIWFNDDLWRTRWINEGFAELYAVEAGELLGQAGETYELPEDPGEARIPLSAWRGVGVEELPVEDYAYAASYVVAGAIAERAGWEGLARVWTAADLGHASYQPVHEDEPVRGAPVNQPEWQRFLDLLEERTGQRYDDLWEEWILTDEDARLLDDRSAARAEYAGVIAMADAWELPGEIRTLMGDWAFDEALAELEVAADVLEDRDRIAARAAALGLEPPDDLQRAFESGPGLQDAVSEAGAQLATLELLDRAGDVLDDEPTALETIGLFGSDPRALLAVARDGYEDGDLEEADAAARLAISRRSAAVDQGTDRVVLAGGGLLLLDGLALVGLSALRIRRRHDGAPGPASPTF
ncbi:MAG TPA: hypothetical protein VFH63_05125 [candidate division Zixibacteria bacterium]|nr:hypothetical protein [candidate division Zixibacteria bacterium]